MSTARVSAVLLLLAATLPAFHAQNPQTSTLNRIQLTLNSDEANAVLAILDKHSAGTAISDGNWQRLFATEPYIRLKKREASLHRDFADEDFQKFVLSPELAAKATALRKTLDT